MNRTGEDFCNRSMIAVLKFPNHFYSHPARVIEIVKKATGCYCP